MSPDQRLNVAMLGTKFMGRAHAHAWRTAGRFFDLPTEPGLRIVAGRDAEATRAFADRWGWEEATTRWRTAVSHPEVDLVDVATPNDLHAEQAIAALEAGKHVACEKPLAGTLDDARAHARRGPPGRGRHVRLVQLPAGPGRGAGPSAGPSRLGRPDLPRPRRLPAGLGRPRHAAALALSPRGGRLRSPRRPQCPHRRHGPVPHRRGDRGGQRLDRRDLHQGADAPRRPEPDGAEHRRRRRPVPGSLRRRRDRPASSRPDWPRG